MRLAPYFNLFLFLITVPAFATHQAVRRPNVGTAWTGKQEKDYYYFFDQNPNAKINRILLIPASSALQKGNQLLIDFPTVNMVLGFASPAAQAKFYEPLQTQIFKLNQRVRSISQSVSCNKVAPVGSLVRFATKVPGFTEFICWMSGQPLSAVQVVSQGSASVKFLSSLASGWGRTLIDRILTFNSELMSDGDEIKKSGKITGMNKSRLSNLVVWSDVNYLPFKFFPIKRRCNSTHLH